MRKWTYLIITIFLVSCYAKNKVPSNIIHPEKMKTILWDAIRAQSLANEMKRKDSSLDLAITTRNLTREVFKIHHTDSVDFNKSYIWYVKHPDVLKLIFDSLYIQKQRENDSVLKKPDHPKPLPQ